MKNLKWNLILMSLLYIGLGIFLLLGPGMALNIVCYALGGVVLAFVSGVLSLVFATLPWVLALHKAVSISCVFFLAIHIFAYRRTFKGD